MLTDEGVELTVREYLSSAGVSGVPQLQGYLSIEPYRLAEVVDDYAESSRAMDTVHEMFKIVTKKRLSGRIRCRITRRWLQKLGKLISPGAGFKGRSSGRTPRCCTAPSRDFLTGIRGIRPFLVT
jgi:hypothetical protein